MRHPALDRLLILQDRDTKRLGLEAQLKALPREVAAVEQKIAAEKAAIEAARVELRELESKKKLLETEIGSGEEKLAKYRTQQLSVRKNDEYQALGTEIAHLQAAIGKLEEQDLGIMYAIDEAKQRFAAAEAALRENISGHEAKIRTLKERDVNLQAELKDAREQVAAARATLEEPPLRVYDRVATRHAAPVAALRGSKCGGCHLKVSSEVESDARKGEKLAQCDQCGRILYFDY